MMLKLLLPPLIEMLFQPLKVAPGVIWMKETGFRIAPAPMPQLIGNSAICLSLRVVETSTSSVFSSDDSAVTSTESVTAPTFMVTSTRVVTANCTSTLGYCDLLNPACSTESVYVPTGTSGNV